MDMQVSKYIISKSRVAGPCMDKPESIRCKTCIMDASHFFKDLDVCAKKDLQPFLKIKNFTCKEMLYKEGDSCNNLYILLSGEVKIYKSTRSGKHQIYKLVHIPGDLIACDDLFLDYHGSSAETITDVTTCYINRNEFLKQLNKNSEISIAMMRFMSLNINSYIRHIANLGQKNALARVASYIFFLYETHLEYHMESTLLHNSLSRIELSEMLGVTQRTLIRSLKQLEKNKLITITKDGFLALDIEELQILSES